MEHHDNIQMEVSSPRQPQENGSSKRSVRAITEKARVLMMNAPHLPTACGGRAVLHASALLQPSHMCQSHDMQYVTVAQPSHTVTSHHKQCLIRSPLATQWMQAT